MPRPSKAIATLKAEKSTHITKREIAYRERAENALLSGYRIKETREIKADSIAHKEFLRVKGLLEAINKNDEIYGAPVRRYCITRSRLNSLYREIETEKKEYKELKTTRDKISDRKKRLEYIRIISNYERIIEQKERLAKWYRAEMSEFEKENCMTIKSALILSTKQGTERKNTLKEILQK